MANYKLVFRRSVAKDLRAIPKKDVARILASIQTLASNPRPQDCEKLSAQERYRLRQGNYRILYEIQNELLIVTVVKVGHRSDVYRANR
ncbi:MAG: type II toxin-antitoxin system RelE family toxin [Gammaproteobacteria bacterium]